MLGYTYGNVPDVQYVREMESDIVIVSIGALTEKFFDSINSCIVNLISDSERREIVEFRLNQMVMSFPADSAEDYWRSGR